MARIIALANQKGGVAKTTSTLALGAALVNQGQRVLLVDLDPQASLTSAAGEQVDADVATVYALLHAYVTTGDVPPIEAALRSIVPELDLVPASIELAVAEIELQNAPRREYILSEILSGSHEAYDLILIDCPPSLSLLTVNALTAADEVLIPVVPDYLAARGLGMLLDSIERMRKNKLNPRLSVAGVILTMVDSRTTHSRETMESIRAFLGDRIPILGEVKRSTKTAEAAAAGVPITVYAPQSEAALAYGSIAAGLLGEGDLARQRDVANTGGNIEGEVLLV